MADISKEIKDFRDAQYGEEVRGSLISLAEKLNKESTDAKDAAEQAVKDAHESIEMASAAASEANDAAGLAAASAEAADEAASGANNAAILASGAASAADAASAGANAAAKEASDVADEVQEKLDNGEFVGPPGSIENLMEQSITFEQAAARANIQSGDSLAVAFGKLAKFCYDLKDVAFSGSYNDLEDKPSIPAATKVKGDAEEEYRDGEVNLTADNIGALAKNGDSAENIVNYTSGDTDDTAADKWESVPALTSGMTHANLFSRISNMFKNVRYLYKMLGTTDISKIGGGTVTGAISELNTGLYDLRFTKVYTNVPDIDNVPGYLCETGVYPNGFPEDLGGNECFVITMRPGADISAQLAFGFYNDKIAIRHRIQLDWSNWRYFNPSS